MIQKPYGMFLITGPTGSGKSFTTFSVLKRIAVPEVNVSTVEDPVEYEIPGINQTQVNEKAGLDFARALLDRSCVRIPTSSWSARFAIRSRPRSRSRRP